MNATTTLAAPRTAPRPPLAVGQRVRYIGTSGTIRNGAIGKITGYHSRFPWLLVAEFPKHGDTYGPHCSFGFTDHDADLEPVQTSCHVCGLPIARDAATESWNGNLRHARGTCPKLSWQ